MGCEMKFDVIFIGDRFAAYAAASILSRRGRSVCVLPEPDPLCGTNRILVKDGFNLDFGILSERAVGIDPNPVISAAGLKPMFFPRGNVYHYNGAKLNRVPSAFNELFSARTFGSSSMKAFASLFFKLKRLNKGTSENGTSMGEWINGLKVSNDDYIEAASLLGAICWDFPDFEKIPVSLVFETINECPVKTSSIPFGGWKNVFASMENIIREKGDILDVSKIERIVIDGGRAKGAIVDGESLEADFVVVCAQNSSLQGLCLSDYVKDEFRHILNGNFSVSGVSLDLGIEGKISESKDQIVTLDPFTHGMVVSNVEPALAPRGCQLLSWFAPASKSEIDCPDGIKNIQVRIKDVIELLFPGAMDRIVVERWRAGEANSSRVCFAQSGERRPSLDAFSIPNILLLNDSLDYGGRKGDPALAAALELPSII